jgi:hypothetical protein
MFVEWGYHSEYFSKFKPSYLFWACEDMWTTLRRELFSKFRQEV